MSVKEPLALKYRPKKLSEVIGQPVVVKAFTNAFKNDTLHHAYILAGNFGCGKTTVARIIAAMENCKKGGADPCGECSNCKDIFAGKSMEVIEMDAGSGGKVDDIRELHKTLYNSPINVNTRYVIIDEAHSLTGAAAEASLKMIEEPPSNVRFILCTTEPQAFKPTIHSRCIMWTFHKVSRTEILSHLKNIADQEGIEYDDKALHIIARSAKGSVRNCLQHLQTVINYVGDDYMSVESAIEALGVIDDTLYYDLIDAIINKDFVKSFGIVNRLFLDGKEAKTIIDGLYEHMNNLLIARTCDQNDLHKFGFSQEESKKLVAQTWTIQSGTILMRMLSHMSHVAFDIEYSLNPAHTLNKFVVESVQDVRTIRVSK